MLRLQRGRVRHARLSHALLLGHAQPSSRFRSLPGKSFPLRLQDLTQQATRSHNLTSCLQCALLANSAGVGGGPLYIPLFNTVLGFDIPHCTALSHTVVSVSAVGSSLYGMLQPSPTHPDRPLLNFDLALTFIPPLLFGVSVG